MFKNWPQFANCIGRINNTQVYDAHDTDVVKPIYDLIEYSDNYSKTSGVLSQFYRDAQAIDDDGAIADFNAANATTRR